jgi:hypothetical protein
MAQINHQQNENKASHQIQTAKSAAEQQAIVMPEINVAGASHAPIHPCMTPHNILALQHQVGNQSVQRLIRMKQLMNEPASTLMPDASSKLAFRFAFVVEEIEQGRRSEVGSRF